jgi:hypothetical protein
VPGVAAASLDALRSTASTDADAVVAFLGAISRSGGALPPEERARLESGGAWQVVSALRYVR